MAIEYDRTTPVLDNTNVDNINGQRGVVDQLTSLDLNITDRDIIRNLDWRIQDSESYWNDAKGFDLKNLRASASRFHLGKVDEQGLYRHQKQYKENQIFVAEESIVAYVTSQIAGPLVIPAGQDPKQKIFAGELEKAIKCHSEDVVDLEQIVEVTARNVLNKFVGIIHFYYDKTIGDIVAEACDPEDFTLDKNAALGQNPGFICRYLKRTVEELIAEYPDKEKVIMDACGMQRKTKKQLTKELVIRKVWVTHYNAQNEPEESVVVYFEDVVLSKVKNPNYLYARKDLNLLRYPKKPFIFCNLVNYGKHLVDSTSPLLQAIPMQQYLNRRGRQIGENADKANGMLVIATESGLTKDDTQNMVGDPNQKLLVKTNGQSVEQLVHQIEAQQLPQYVIEDKQDARMQVGNLMGAPTDFTGSQADDGDPTLGEVMIKKNQAAGRQDMMVRAITRMLKEYYQYLVQMMIVWYTTPHNFTYDNGDGDFDFITLKRELIHKGIRVKASKPANPDRSRIEAIVLQLLKNEAISLLDAYKLLQLDNAQQLYDNWAKQKTDPSALARDAIDALDESEAYVAYLDILNGKAVEPKENPTKEYILSLRKLMINDEFLNAKKAVQARFVKYVNQCLDSFEKRMQLEQVSDVSGMLPQPAPMTPPVGPGAGAPGQPAMPPLPPQGMPQPAAPMGPPPMTASSVFGGTPIPQPGQSPMAESGNPAILPQL